VPTAVVGTGCADGFSCCADGSGPSAPRLRAVVFGFGFLPVLSEMGEIREFRSFLVIQNLNLRTKVHQMLIFF
jgi:hypothetical protein